MEWVIIGAIALFVLTFDLWGISRLKKRFEAGESPGSGISDHSQPHGEAGGHGEQRSMGPF